LAACLSESSPLAAHVGGTLGSCRNSSHLCVATRDHPLASAGPGSGFASERAVGLSTWQGTAVYSQAQQPTGHEQSIAHRSRMTARRDTASRCLAQWQSAASGTGREEQGQPGRGLASRAQEVPLAHGIDPPGKTGPSLPWSGNLPVRSEHGSLPNHRKPPAAILMRNDRSRHDGVQHTSDGCSWTACTGTSCGHNGSRGQPRLSRCPWRAARRHPDVSTTSLIREDDPRPPLPQKNEHLSYSLQFLLCLASLVLCLSLVVSRGQTQNSPSHRRQQEQVVSG
jgi:hypothetical protein